MTENKINQAKLLESVMEQYQEYEPTDLKDEEESKTKFSFEIPLDQSFQSEQGDATLEFIVEQKSETELLLSIYDILGKIAHIVFIDESKKEYNLDDITQRKTIFDSDKDGNWILRDKTIEKQLNYILMRTIFQNPFLTEIFLLIQNELIPHCTIERITLTSLDIPSIYSNIFQKTWIWIDE